MNMSIEVELTQTLQKLKDIELALNESSIVAITDRRGVTTESLILVIIVENLPINTLKIDKSFINELDVDGEIIVNTIINMGKNLNFTVIAEGIENNSQLEYLKSQDCHEGQGYYFSKPVSAEEIGACHHPNFVEST